MSEKQIETSETKSPSRDEAEATKAEPKRKYEPPRITRKTEVRKVTLFSGGGPTGGGLFGG